MVECAPDERRAEESDDDEEEGAATEERGGEGGGADPGAGDAGGAAPDPAAGGRGGTVFEPLPGGRRDERQAAADAGGAGGIAPAAVRAAQGGGESQSGGGPAQPGDAGRRDDQHGGRGCGAGRVPGGDPGGERADETMSVSKFGAGRSGASGANAAYITRESATEGREENVYLHNAEDLRGEDYRETRTNIISFAHARQDEEQTAKRRGGGESRTHYRGTLTFGRKEKTEKARRMAERFLKENFPKARAVAAVHQDTGHTHVHLWIDARGTDGKKLHLDNKMYKTLDERWAKQYAREYGRHYEQEHLAKKAETREFKRARAQGEERERPKRASRPTKAREHQEREKRNYGVHEITVGRDQPELAGRDHEASGGAPERRSGDFGYGFGYDIGGEDGFVSVAGGGAGGGKPEIDRAAGQLERAERQIDRTESAARDALQSVERIRDGAHERGLEEERGR